MWNRSSLTIVGLRAAACRLWRLARVGLRAGGYGLIKVTARGARPMARGPWPVARRGATPCSALLFIALSVAGCRQDMHDQPKYKPLRASDFFIDGRSERPLVAGTVARGFLRDDDHLYTGKVDGQDVTTFPFAIDERIMRRGRERFDIYCSPCHGRVGDGEGMIVKRGYRRPPSFHEDRLRQAPIGHFFDVMSNGFGAMPDYVGQIAVEDRWAIIAYIRALQLSQRAAAADVPPDERARLAAASAGATPPTPERTGGPPR